MKCAFAEFYGRKILLAHLLQRRASNIENMVVCILQEELQDLKRSEQELLPEFVRYYSGEGCDIVAVSYYCVESVTVSVKLDPGESLAMQLNRLQSRTKLES